MKSKKLLKTMLSHKKVRLNKRGLKWYEKNKLEFTKNKFVITLYFDDNVVTLMDSKGFLMTEVKPKYIKKA